MRHFGQAPEPRFFALQMVKCGGDKSAGTTSESQTAVDNMAAEGIVRGAHIVGDVMADALADAAERGKNCSRISEQVGLSEKGNLLATIHRPENTDDPGRLRNILAALAELDEPVIFPVHPRTRWCLADFGFMGSAPGPEGINGNKIRYIEPLGYLDMVRLEQSARMILTDRPGSS